jgi:RimJ/RimL family protein N-acetyltransferase
VARGEAAPLRAVRLRALSTDADAFGSTTAREEARPAAWWEEWAAASGAGEAQRTFVVVDERHGPGGPFLGLAMACRDPAHSDGAVIYSMWVAPEIRGQGSGLFLCEMSARWALERGLTALRLAVFDENARARRAYANAGFVVEDRAVVKTGDGRVYEELRMVRPLKPGESLI